MKRAIIILIAFYLAASFSYSQSGLNEAEDFFVKDVNGASHTLFSYLEEGKIVVIPFFTTTCGSCNIYTPEIVESYHDFGCNEGDVFYLGVNWGANNIGVIDFMAVHAVGYPCASGLEGLGNEVHEQYEIASNITALVILPDGTIAGEFYGPDSYPTRDSLNNLLLSLGAEMQVCGVGIEDDLFSDVNVFPNPAKDYLNIQFKNPRTGKFILEVYDAQGKLIMSNNINLYFQDKIVVNTNEFINGTYFVNLIEDDEIIISQKLIKK